MPDLLTAEEFRRLSQGFEHTAFRLETHERYLDEEEREPVRRFLAGEPADDAWFMDWYKAILMEACSGGTPGIRPAPLG